MDDTIIIPLPIELPSEDTNSNPLKIEPTTTNTTNTHSPDPNEVLPPPLPVVNTNNSPQQQPQPQPPKYNSHSPYHSGHFSPSMAPHLRAPPPLTPMEKIADDGTIIGYENEYIMAPPPLPQQSQQSIIEYNCNECRISFNTKTELLSHRRNIHEPIQSATHFEYDRVAVGAGNGRQLRFYCNICGRNFSGKQHYQYHMRTHSGEKPYTCSTCGKTFRAKHSLKNHIRIHTGERPYPCKVCGKWFRQLGVMKNHTRKMHSLRAN